MMLTLGGLIIIRKRQCPLAKPIWSKLWSKKGVGGRGCHARWKNREILLLFATVLLLVSTQANRANRSLAGDSNNFLFYLAIVGAIGGRLTEPWSILTEMRSEQLTE